MLRYSGRKGTFRPNSQPCFCFSSRAAFRNGAVAPMPAAATCSGVPEATMRPPS